MKIKADFPFAFLSLNRIFTTIVVKILSLGNEKKN